MAPLWHSSRNCAIFVAQFGSRTDAGIAAKPGANRISIRWWAVKRPVACSASMHAAPPFWRVASRFASGAWMVSSTPGAPSMTASNGEARGAWRQSSRPDALREPVFGGSAGSKLRARMPSSPWSRVDFESRRNPWRTPRACGCYALACQYAPRKSRGETTWTP